MSTTTFPDVIELSAEIMQVAKDFGVVEELHRVLAMTQRLFPDYSMRVEIDDDPEIANDRHLLIVVQDRIADVKEALAIRRRWNGELFQCCAVPLAHVFRLGMEYQE